MTSGKKIERRQGRAGQGAYVGCLNSMGCLFTCSQYLLPLRQNSAVRVILQMQQASQGSPSDSQHAMSCFIRALSAHLQGRWPSIS